MVDNNDVFNGNGIKIDLADPKYFVMIMETLTRIGVYSEKNKTLTQSVHLLHKRGKYAIMHFKELFLMDGKSATISAEDYARRDKIAKLIEEWGLCSILPNQILEENELNPDIKIISAKDKENYTLTQKYTLGGIDNKKKKKLS